MYNQSQLKEIIDRALSALAYNNEADRLIEPVKYSLSVGGKRIRPILTLMSCNLFTDNITEAVQPAAGIEILHNFTLVHDDIMDNASVRRNFPTAFAKWGLNQALLSGDVMMFLANECFLQLPADKIQTVLKIFNSTAIQICQGQQLDMDYEKKDFIVDEDYIHMIKLKTAVLIAASLKIGAFIGGADEKETKLLYDFGENIGLAFQIQDDILDIWSDEKVFGKVHGGDIASNKKTYPFIKALEIANVDQQRKLRQLYSPKCTTKKEEKIKEVCSVFEELKIKEIATATANKYIEKAFELLNEVNADSTRKTEMINMINGLIGRTR